MFDGKSPVRWFVDMYRLPPAPKLLVAVALIGLVGSWIAFPIIFRARVSKSEQPRVHIFQDMDNQAMYKAQSTSTMFADGRAMRPPVPGTVARGDLMTSAHFNLGFKIDANGTPILVPVEGSPDQKTNDWYTGYPDVVTVDVPFIQRGRKVYNTFCYPCHGLNGQGEGPVHIRSSQLMALDPGNNRWTPPSNLMQMQGDQMTYGAELYPNGKLYSVIANGIRSMAGYSSQIEPEDRWAVVAYVRALQLSQRADVDVLTPQQQQQLAPQR